MAQARGQRRNRGNGQQGAQQPRQELSMNDALLTLASMFDTVDKNVIQMVLVEGCNGNMEQAVEALLKITESQSSNNANNGSNAPNSSSNANNNNNNSGNSGSNNAAPAAFGLPQPNEDAVTRATKSKRNNSQQRGRIDKRKNKEIMNQQLAQRAQNHQQRSQQQSPANRNVNANANGIANDPANGRVVNLPDDFLRPPSYYLERYPKERQNNANQDNANNNNANNNNNNNSDPNFDQKAEREKQIIEDEIFAKAIFEDALFAQDLMNHPEWMDDNANNELNVNYNHNRSRSQSNVNSNRLKSPFTKNPFRNRRANSSVDVTGNSNNNEIDPSNPQARKAKFKENLNSLSDAARSRMMNLASKLQRNKEEKRKGTKPVSNNASASHGASYGNALRSIDDETLIDDADENLEIDMASEQNRGTYKPPKPAQAL